MKATLIVEGTVGEAFEQEIEIAEGDRLIFKIDAPARKNEMEEVAKRIQRFFDGASKFLVIDKSISVIRVRTSEEDR